MGIAIDFSKCLEKDDKYAEMCIVYLITSVFFPFTCRHHNASHIPMDYKAFLNFIGEELTEKFKSLDAVINNEKFNDEFIKLYKMWKLFNNDDIVEDDSGNAQEVKAVEFKNSDLVLTFDENAENLEIIDDY